MKKIEAIIRISRFEEVTEALHEVGIDFFTYWDVTGVGNEKSGAVYRATVYETRLIPRRMISFVCRDQFANASVEAIVRAGKTGELGDGKVFISTIDDSVRIRTGEFGPESLYIKN
jgi:nitrogen regulatory protein P-II 1